MLGISAESTIKLLRNTGWNTDAAVNEFLDNPAPYSPGINQAKIEEVFQQYKDKESAEDIVGLDGLMEIYEILDLSGTDLLTLVFNFQFRAKSAEKLTHQEFVNGMIRIGCESVEDVKKKLPALRDDLSDAGTFKEFYLFCFDFSREQETHKILALDVATQLWELVMEGRYAMLDKWFTFLQEEHNKPIQRDVWQLFLDFTIQVKLDTSNYDDCESGGAWPCLIDDYVDWLKDKKHI
jgi:DCN1-like protein 1/2